MSDEKPKQSWTDELIAALSKLDWKEIRDQRDADQQPPLSAPMPLPDASKKSG